MEIEKLRKGIELIEKLDKFYECKKMLDNGEYGRVAHFEFVQHYGKDPELVVFGHEYTKMFLPVVDEIIKNLEKEILKL